MASFPTLIDGVSAYIALMNRSPQFGPSIRRGTTPQQQAFILGNCHPVWASGQYRDNDGRGAPGTALVDIINRNGLTRYDAPAKPPLPPPPAPVLPPQTSSPRGSDVLHTIPIATDPSGNGWVLTTIPWADFCGATLQGSDPATDGGYKHGSVLVQDRNDCVLVSVSFATANSVAYVFVWATS